MHGLTRRRRLVLRCIVAIGCSYVMRRAVSAYRCSRRDRRLLRLRLPHLCSTARNEA
jgi:hypothetical protein